MKFVDIHVRGKAEKRNNVKSPEEVPKKPIKEHIGLCKSQTKLKIGTPM